ncbi:hypothetical protein [Magnetospirillum sp. UT-4]|uniref:hypothetical protein n=1 Tax=Magnetospirillum sp. UT-4 TaxID=2681467 RepID=UPI00137F6A80|nr:hypothetical protein [Magnetospirillum sp. UT-4]CAA7616912.1 conserved hypothetical protein [Magnetospirillum sp. UT-4]
MASMATAAGGAEGGDAIRRVNDTLRGAVVDVMGTLVPEVKALPREKAFERTLDDLALLERCFKTFRARRERFTAVLVDEAKRPVADDTTPLSCGRTLDQVVAMIVRTTAKRYFRRRWSPDQADRPLAPRFAKSGLMDKVGALLNRPAAAASTPAEPGRADELYHALKEHLLHEWQVPLVPTYADMTPRLAIELGAKILELRDPEHLKRVVADPDEAAKLFEDAPAPAAAPEPAPAPAAKGPDQRAPLHQIIAPGGQRLRIEAFSGVLRRQEVRDLVKEGRSMARLSEILSGVGGGTAKLLVGELALRLDQLAVVLLVAHDTVGADVFVHFFGHPGDPEVLRRLVARAREAKLDQSSDLLAWAGFIAESLAPLARTR